MHMADFYSGSHVKRNKLRSMFVLEDAEHAVATSDCNNIASYHRGKHLHDHLQSLLRNSNLHSSPIAAGCYHRDAETNNDEVTFFPGHLDKPFVHTAWFVPIGPATFFTVLSVPSACNQIQDAESFCIFQEWKSKLSSSESKRVDDFLREFDNQAEKYSRVESPVRLLFLNKLGSVLSFPANTYYHATITPKKPPGYPRDLFIFHPLDGLS